MLFVLILLTPWIRGVEPDVRSDCFRNCLAQLSTVSLMERIGNTFIDHTSFDFLYCIWVVAYGGIAHLFWFGNLQRSCRGVCSFCACIWDTGSVLIFNELLGDDLLTVRKRSDTGTQSSTKLEREKKSTTIYRCIVYLRPMLISLVFYSIGPTQ